MIPSSKRSPGDDSVSIVVSLKVSDGIVVATDSMASIASADPQGNILVAQMFENANKLFQFPNLPIAVACWGMAGIGARTVDSLMAEFSDSATIQLGEVRVENIAGQLLKFLKNSYEQQFPGPPQGQPDNRPFIGVLVCGYSTNGHFGEEYEFSFPTRPNVIRIHPDQQNRNPVFGAAWRGETEAIMRLTKGYDPNLPQFLRQQSVTEEQVDTLRGIPTLIQYQSMPLQDAIDLASFWILLTKQYFRFRMGPPFCGGPTDIAVITKNGFTWIQRKSLKYKPME